MAALELTIETALGPDEVRAALLDFSVRRPEIWPDLEPSLYKVHSVGETSADVTEGSKMPGMTVWAREAYDWSSLDTIRWTVTESNFCAAGSYVAATISAGTDGGTRLHVEWDRTGTSFKGKVIIGLIRLTKGKPIASSVTKAFRRMEQAEANP